MAEISSSVTRSGPSIASASEHLVEVVQELSLARSLERVMQIVRTAARQLTGADGATFVLRDGPHCFYADEDAISPLWKGSRFPLGACISGWAMLNRQHAVIPDIYKDPRIPHDAYRPTFVKSLVMVPIRKSAPIGSIGTYWAHERVMPPEQLKLLQALADSTSIAMENVELVSNLERRVRDRTAQLEAVNRELEKFSYSVSHDLRAPLRSISGFSEAVLEDDGENLSDGSKAALGRVVAATGRMGELIDALLGLAKLSQSPLALERVDLTALAREVFEALEQANPGAKVDVTIHDSMLVEGDAPLLRVALTNLIGNAWKFSSKAASPHIEVGSRPVDGTVEYFVKDNGAGFDMRYAERLFGAFQRLHAHTAFEGTGIGLATVARVVARHGGRIRAEGKPGEGATFAFTLGPTVVATGVA
ncbi:MAG: GAF domain-containing protein [Myxococcaceae bacterium]|nr:GAF domain-containing protein [Myxococcaceae bacterium]